MNQELINALDELKDVFGVLGDTYRESAFRRAVLELEKLDYKLTQENLTQLQKTKGIGNGILERIREFIATGSIKELETLREELVAFRELSLIMGAGPTTVRKWLDIGIRGLSDLRKEVAKGGVVLTRTQKLGLMYYQDLQERIPRDEVAAIGEKIKNTIFAICNRITFTIAGSYRRGSTDSGDIDILISGEKFDPDLLFHLADAMRNDSNFVDVISVGEYLLTFLYKGQKVRQVDILNVEYKNYYAALFHFTGSWRFNELMRGRAKKMGYRLNQNGLYHYVRGALRLIKTSSEEEIFKILDLEYIPPHLRNE